MLYVKTQTRNRAILIYIILLIYSGFMSYRDLPFVAMKLMQMGVLVLALLYMIFGRFFPIKEDLALKNYVWLFMLFPWLSIIPAYITHGQTPMESAMVLTVESGVFLLYFFLIKIRATEKQVILALAIFAFVYTFFEYFQQITYPVHWFAGREESDATGMLKMRQGLYRFGMSGSHYLSIPLFFYWQQLLQRYSLQRLSSFLFILLGLYGVLARKLLIAFVAGISYSFLNGKAVRWYHWFAILTVGTVIFFNLDTWFAEYVERTNNDLEQGENWVRAQSTAYFLNYFDDQLCLLLGNGRENGQSEYGNHIRGLGEMFGFRRNDTGIYGYFNLYGIIGMLPLVLFVIFLVRKWRKIPIYIRMYFIFTAIQFTVAFPLNATIGTVAFVFVLYLIEINMVEKPRLVKRVKPKPGKSTLPVGAIPVP